MIHKDTYTLEWMTAKSKEFYHADPILVEKVIMAMCLLEQLQIHGVDFIFKGGTSLMLLLDEPRRFSIDIDIILLGNIDEIEDKLEEVIKSSPFNELKLVIRKKVSNIDKEHYKMYFEPLTKTRYNKENILLDILIEENPYSEIESKEIKSPFLKLTEPIIEVKVPTIKSILADKLTAYPPNTTGIPYIKNENGMGLQICKQLFDIARLTDSVQDLEGVRKDFDNIAYIELEYRELDDTSTKEVLQDIIDTSLCLSTKGLEGVGDYDELLSGSRRLVPFIFGEIYNYDKATTDSSKAAYVAHCLMSNITELEKYKDPKQVLDLTLDNINSKGILRLRKGNPEAFFYWHQVLS